MSPVRSKKVKISADSLEANRTSNGMKKSVILRLVDRLMGAGESIHTVTLSWGTVAVSSKKIWCVSRRHQRYAVYQAVSSVAPSVCQFNISQIGNNSATLAGGTVCISEGSNGPGLGTSLSIANWYFSSSTSTNVPVDILKPIEGIEPSVPGIPSPRPSQTTGCFSLYSKTL